MKQVAFAAFVAFWASIATLGALWGLTPPAISATEAVNEVFSAEEVAEHATPEDCWMIIEDVVYDFSDYIPTHPAPPDVMAPWCGREATEGMRTKGYGNDHSDRAWEMMSEYRIGTFDGEE